MRFWVAYERRKLSRRTTRIRMVADTSPRRATTRWWRAVSLQAPSSGSERALCRLHQRGEDAVTFGEGYPQQHVTPVRARHCCSYTHPEPRPEFSGLQPQHVRLHFHAQSRTPPTRPRPAESSSGARKATSGAWDRLSLDRAHMKRRRNEAEGRVRRHQERKKGEEG